MRIAIVHDWLESYAGAERVLEQIINCFPEADLFALVDFLPEGKREFIGDKPVTTSFIQRLPFSRKHFRKYLPLFPIAIQQLDLSGYDIILSHSTCVAKGVITGPDQLHICYCNSPMRYAWDLQHQYLEETGMAKGLKSAFVRLFLHRLRIWDTASSAMVDKFVGNSRFIGRRIQKFYRRPSDVIYPPVAVDEFVMGAVRKDYYLTASRMVPYKCIPLMVRAFAAMPSRQLVVIGDGPEMAKVRKAAQGAENIKIMGYQPFDVLKRHMQEAKAFVFAAVEDFGIIPLEAQACGTPVIAYKEGGAVETVVDISEETPTGVFFDKQSVESICEAVEKFEQSGTDILPEDCRANACGFSEERFRTEITEYVNAAWDEFCGQ